MKSDELSDKIIDYAAMPIGKTVLTLGLGAVSAGAALNGISYLNEAYNAMSSPDAFYNVGTNLLNAGTWAIASLVTGAGSLFCGDRTLWYVKDLVKRHRTHEYQG